MYVQELSFGTQTIDTLSFNSFHTVEESTPLRVSVTTHFGGVRFWCRITAPWRVSAREVKEFDVAGAVRDHIEILACARPPFDSIYTRESYPVKSGISNALQLPFLLPSNKRGRFFFLPLTTNARNLPVRAARYSRHPTHAAARPLPLNSPTMPSLSVFPKT